MMPTRAAVRIVHDARSAEKIWLTFDDHNPVRLELAAKHRATKQVGHHKLARLVSERWPTLRTVAIDHACNTDAAHRSRGIVYRDDQLVAHLAPVAAGAHSPAWKRSARWKCARKLTSIDNVGVERATSQIRCNVNVVARRGARRPERVDLRLWRPFARRLGDDRWRHERRTRFTRLATFELVDQVPETTEACSSCEHRLEVGLDVQVVGGGDHVENIPCRGSTPNTSTG